MEIRDAFKRFWIHYSMLLVHRSWVALFAYIVEKTDVKQARERERTVGRGEKGASSIFISSASAQEPDSRRFFPVFPQIKTFAVFYSAKSPCGELAE